MTHQDDYTFADEITEKGLEVVPELVHVLNNNTLHVERSIFFQAVIQKHVAQYPILSTWMDENLAKGFTVFDFPLEHRRTIRTTNNLERINEEIRRRTKVVGVFSNEASCLRLISD